MEAAVWVKSVVRKPGLFGGVQNSSGFGLGEFVLAVNCYMGMKFANPVPAASVRFTTSRPAVAGFMRGTKKTVCLLGLLLGTTFAAPAIQVTYQLNLGTQIVLGNFHPGADTVFVSGTFSSPTWKSTASDGSTSYLLTPVGGNTNLYTGTFNIVNSAGSTESHKFIINPGGSFSALNWESPTSTLGGNRTLKVPGVATNLPVVYFNDQVLPDAAPFVAGADFSLLTFFENQGIVYKTNGWAQDALAILKNQGVTCVRLRLFTSSAAQAQADPYNYTNNLDYTVPLAVRVKNAGLQFMLDFHYSDTWADPGHQAKPAAWTSLTSAQLVQQMHDYNSNCIAAFNAAGAMPDYVQVGNEITGGMLWTNGAVPGANASAQWLQLGQLMKAAIQGISDAAGTNMPKIIVHIDRGGDWANTQWFFDNLNAQGVPYDIIGESYYPYWHGPLSGVANCLTNAAKRYAKPVMIAETDFPWTNSYWTTNIYGIPGTTNGQVQFLVALAQVVRNVPGRLGAGIFWWGAEYQHVNGVNEAGVNTASFFDSGGNVLPVANAFGQMVALVTLTPGLADTTLTLQWPLSGAGMTLMTATNLMSPAVWLPVPNTVQSTGTWFTVSLPVDSSQSRFYRLQSN
jgi:arabinogalactan endo-1,4-beta-galactosidase